MRIRVLDKKREPFPRLRFGRRYPGSQVGGVDFELVSIGIEEVE